MTVSVLPGGPAAGVAAKHPWSLGGGALPAKPREPQRRARGPGGEEPCAGCRRPGHDVAEDGRSYCGGCLRAQQARKTAPWQKLSTSVGTAEDSDGEVVGLCGKCGLALGAVVYYDSDGQAALHGECVAQCMMESVRSTDEKRQKTSHTKKQAMRDQYNIGWSVESVPQILSPAKKLGCEVHGDRGLCSLVFDEETRSIRVVETLDAASCVNLEYLALALEVRKSEGREPQFSLDPLDASMDPDRSRQRKRFEPDWLMGTSVGEVMFQADYYLKELSMGEYNQPVVGMKSAFDVSEAEGWSDWSAREWYVVRKANICLSEANVLVPIVEMGVEAREQSSGPAGLVDALITRLDHPLVKYAEQFTHYFDVIAERKSVVYHLREVAKAVVLAKFLLDADVNLHGSWSDVVDWLSVKNTASACHMEIPQLWNDRSNSSVRVRDGTIIGGRGTTNTHSVYGGVNFGLDRAGLSMYPPRLSTLDLGMATAQVDPASSIQAISGVLMKAQGVDLDLGRFDLSAPERIVLPRVPPISSGKAFWSAIDSDSVANACLLRDLFNPSLSDRRNDGDRFVGPNPSAAYMDKLRHLLAEEAEVKQERLEAFCSKDFAIGSAGALFPPCWTASVKVDDWQAPRQVEVLYNDEADPDILRSAKPVFDETTEDGVRFRIYKEGTQEVRTTQAQDCPEEVVAVLSNRSHVLASIAGDEPILKVRQYVTGAPGSEGNPGAQPGERRRLQYFVLLQTRKYCIITERLPSGVVVWKESPEDLEERLSNGRLIGSVDSSQSNVLVEDLRSYWSRSYTATRDCRDCQEAVSASACKHYAQTAYNWVYREVFGAGPRRWDSTKKPIAPRKASANRERVPEERRAVAAVEPSVELKHRMAPLFKVAKVLRSDAEVALAAMERDGLDLKHVGDELRGQHRIALAAVRENGMALQYAPQHMSDCEIVHAAVQQDGESLQFASRELRCDHDLVLAAVQQNPCALEHASEALRGDRDICLAASQHNSYPLKYAAEGIFGDRELILSTVGRSPAALAYAPDALLRDPEFMLAAVERNGLSVQHLPPDLCSHRGFVLELVGRSGFALRAASCELRADAEVVLAAGRQDGRAVKYADRERLLAGPGGAGGPGGGAGAELQELLLGASPPRTAVLCSRSHALERLVAQHGRHVCDGCGGLIVQGREYWGCSDVGCCFDLCPPCLELEEVKQLGQWPSADREGSGAATGAGTSHQQAGAVRTVRAGHSERDYHVVGSWDDWTEFVRLEPVDASCTVFSGSVKLCGSPVSQSVNFQIVQDLDWASRFHPSGDGKTILGPDGKHGLDWEVWLPARTMELVVTWDPRESRSISWKPMGVFGELSEIPKPLGGTEFSIAGSWNRWKDFTSFMPAGEAAFQAHIPVDAMMGRVEFQVFQNRSWDQRFYPAKGDAGVVGPTQDTGENWCAELPEGCSWLRVLWHPRGQRRKATWSFLGAQGQELEAAGPARG